MTWTKVAEKGEIQTGKSKECDIDGKKIAVFNQDGFHALDGICQHQDGSIAPEGKIEGDIVECPLHFWHYNIKTGELMDYLKGIKLKKYNVDVRDDGIYVDA